jgi:hypothetical protein
MRRVGELKESPEGVYGRVLKDGRVSVYLVLNKSYWHALMLLPADSFPGALKIVQISSQSSVASTLNDLLSPDPSFVLVTVRE